MSSVAAVLSPSKPSAPVTRPESRSAVIAPVRLQFPPAAPVVFDASRASPVPESDLSFDNVEHLMSEFESAARQPNLTHRQFNHNFVNPLLRICKDANAHDVLREVRVAERLAVFLTSDERHMMTAAAVMLSNMVATAFPLAAEQSNGLRTALEDLKESRVKPEWERVFSTRECHDRDHLTMA